MSGEEELAPTPTKQQLENVTKILDEYERTQVGLPGFVKPGEDSELQDYLIMDREQLEKLFPEDCAYIAYRLTQWVFHIQRAQNRDQARMTWAMDNIKHYISRKPLQGYSYDEKIQNAIRDDIYGTSLWKIHTHAKQRFDRLNFMSNSLNNLATMMKNIQFNKQRNQDE